MRFYPRFPGRHLSLTCLASMGLLVTACGIDESRRSAKRGPEETFQPGFGPSASVGSLGGEASGGRTMPLPSGTGGVVTSVGMGGRMEPSAGTGGSPGSNGGAGGGAPSDASARDTRGSADANASGGKLDASPSGTDTRGVGGAMAVLVNAPSCAQLPATCGSDRNESCCGAPQVPGGTFNRSNDPKYPAKISPFWLDKFEVTVGRFRRFIEGYPANKPAVGSGKHPKIAASGWKAGWSNTLPADKAAMLSYLKCNPKYHTWTDTPGQNENKPLNCVSWYMAHAFCAWDGGRIPTDAEINFAATGGSEQRKYPWGSAEPERDAKLMSWGCYATKGVCTGATDIPLVGSSPAGNGRWGHADLAGSMWERALDDDPDDSGRQPLPCRDCADLKYGDSGPQNSSVRGGAFTSEDPEEEEHQNAIRERHNAGPAGIPPEQGSGTVFGLRCARDM